MKNVLSVDVRSKTALNLILLLLFILSACSGVEPLTDSTAEREAETDSVSRDLSEMEALYWSRLENSRMSFVQADIDFMIDMITHHSQALILSNLAPKNGGSQSIQTLAARIYNSQQDEIATMQKWLRDRGQPVPEVHIDGLILMVTIKDESPEMDHGMMDDGKMDDGMMDDGKMNDGMMDDEMMDHEKGQDEGEHSDGDMESTDHRMSDQSMQHHDMPGMLTQEQLEELAAATGSEFDKKFLTFMIEHHEGAVFMVNELFAANGAANDNEIFDLASAIHVDQITEINRMNLMLEEIEEE